jgi:hypothetical protein
VPPQILGQAAARYLDLAILAPPTGVLALAVTAKQQDDPAAGGVAEHSDERRLAVRARLEAKTELEQPASELAPELGVTDADTVSLATAGRPRIRERDVDAPTGLP